MIVGSAASTAGDGNGTTDAGGSLALGGALSLAAVSWVALFVLSAYVQFVNSAVWGVVIDLTLLFAPFLIGLWYLRNV